VSGRARLSHAYATVGDLAAARAFWTDLIGLEVLVDDDEYLRLGGGGGYTMGMERTTDGDAPELEVVVRVADDDAK
jgi:catechol 2,3-dioxygenase-like lactoylglutathione lyase family enzyme